MQFERRRGKEGRRFGGRFCGITVELNIYTLTYAG
jgi:hypothetical protein